jgi:hypothetical protein
MQLISFRNSREKLPAAGSWASGVHFPSQPNEQGCEYRVSTKFELIDGRRMPLWLELESVWRKHEFGEPMWFARVELRSGAPRIAHIGFRSEDDDREVKWSDFQRARSAIYIFYAAFVAELGSDGAPVYRFDDESEKRIAEFIEQRRTGRRRLKTDDYKHAAQVYRDNFNDTPTQAVADEFDVGIRRAGDIVAECRRRGFLPKTKQGRKKI